MVLEILGKKILDFGKKISEKVNFLKIMSYNFQSRKQILTLRGVYLVKMEEGSLFLWK